jgi:leucyl aminopeptidase
MQTSLPVYLRVLIPAVDNAISGDAFRPGDIIDTREGTQVEIGNTDAEGRLILADALHEGARENPDLLIDFATLTGAARIALGTEIPVFFTPNHTLAQAIETAGNEIQETLWRLPLHEPYRSLLDSPFADCNNISSNSYGGAIIAALFLKIFTKDFHNWLHFDIMAWNIRSRPGRPIGGEAMGLRAIWHYLQKRYPQK